MATKKKKDSTDKGLTPGAPPTSPGGMSRAALAAELVNIHGWIREELDQFKPMDTWPALIEAVVQARRTEEIEREAQRGDIQGLSPEDRVALNEAHREAAEEDQTPPLFIGMPDSQDFIFDGHAGASPSGAERWIACPASVEATRAFLETLSPNQQQAVAEANVAARQGTTAHRAGEAEALVILGRLDPAEAESLLLDLSLIPDEEAYTDEMGEYITEYTDLVRGYATERGAEAVLIEERVQATVELTWAGPDGDPALHIIPGSIDCGVLPSPEHPVLVAADLKYGEGVDVDVDENPQVRIYALGLLEKVVEEHGGIPEWLEDVTYHIVQPRLGGIKTWTETIDELLDWRDEVLTPALSMALAGQDGGAEFNPTEVGCQWCLVRGSCTALIEDRVTKGRDLFEEIHDGEMTGEGFPETGSMTSDRLADLYTQITGLTKLAGEMKEELQRRLHRGTPVPGYHLVNYQPKRFWKEEAGEWLDPTLASDLEATGDSLSEAQTAALWGEPALVSPTAAEKILGEDYTKIAALVVKPPIRPVVAPLGDRRKAWEGKPPEAMFSDLTEEGA